MNTHVMTWGDEGWSLWVVDCANFWSFFVWSNAWRCRQNEDKKAHDNNRGPDNDKIINNSYQSCQLGAIYHLWASLSLTVFSTS